MDKNKNIMSFVLEIESAVKELAGAVMMVSRESQTAAWMHPDGWWVKVSLVSRRDGSIGMTTSWSNDQYEIGEDVADQVIDAANEILSAQSA